MKPQDEALIKDRLLAGYVTSEIARELPHLGKGSVNAYACKVRAKLTPHEKAQADKAKSDRGDNRKVFSANPVCISKDHAEIGRKIAGLRAKNFLTPEDFCSTFEFGTRNTIAKMERGQHEFRLSEMIKIASILNMTLGELATRSA